MTADVTMSAEAVDSDAAASETAPALQDNATIKRMLTESGSFVEAPSPAGVRIVVQPPDLNMVVVGIRIHVGATGSRSSPSQVRVLLEKCAARKPLSQDSPMHHALPRPTYVVLICSASQ